MLLPIIIILILFSCYLLIMLLFLVGLLRLKGAKGKSPVSGLKLTVVIPFRDEVMHLEAIISDLLAQSYPGELFSVLLVNDHSSDGAEELAASLIEGRAGFSCVDLPGGMKGKKEAIAFALSLVKSHWILQTDADCRFEPEFISSHMRYLEEFPSDMVCGMLTTGRGRGGFLEAFERLDLLSLNGSGAGSFPYGRPMMCSGANMLYSLDLYRETRKFDPAGKTGSGDDMFLLIGARKLKKRVAYNPDRDCLVRTSPVGSPAELIGQRIRWGAKSAYYRIADIQFLAIVVVLVNLLVLLSPLLMRADPESCKWLFPAIGSKILVDFLLLAVSTGKTGQSSTLWWYMPVALVYPLYMALVIAGLLLSRPGWKGRKVQESFLR